MPTYAPVKTAGSRCIRVRPALISSRRTRAKLPIHRAIENAERLAQLELQGVEIRAHDPGRRVVAWQRNCVGIGEAACVFDPIHGVDLQAVQLGLVHLLPLFPVNGDYAVERNEYNKNLQVGLRTHTRLPVRSLRAEPLWR